MIIFSEYLRKIIKNFPPTIRSKIPEKEKPRIMANEKNILLSPLLSFSWYLLKDFCRKICFLVFTKKCEYIVLGMR